MLDAYTGGPLFERELDISQGENYFCLQADDYPLTIAASRAGQTVFSIPSDERGAGDFQVAELIAQATAPFVCELAIVGVEGADLCNAPIHDGLMWGTGRRPFRIYPMLLRSGMMLQARIRNLSTTIANVIHLAVRGRRFNADSSPLIREAKLQAIEKRRRVLPYWLTLNLTSVALGALGTAQRYLDIPSGYVLKGQKILYESTGPFSIQIFQGEGGRELTYGATDIRLVGGTGAFPGENYFPLLAQERLRVDLTDLSGAANTVYFTIYGHRVLGKR